MRFNSTLSLAMLASATAAQLTTQLFNFTSSINIENSQLRPNGHLLLTTFYQAQLYTINPQARNPKAELVASLPGATALTGIAPVGHDKYAVVGGVRGSYHYDNETIYTVDFSKNSTNPTIKIVAYVPDADMLNGMASMPSQPHILLIADARLGSIFRVDTTTGASKVVLKDDALAAPANASIPIGINGLQVVGNNVYFTNSALNIFARVPVSKDGQTFGSIEVIASLEREADDTLSDWDDFAIDANGDVYLALPPNSISKIAPDGTQSVVAGGGDSLAFIGPTSVQIAQGGKVAYVTTRGGSESGVAYGGQVVALKLRE
ncbi:uncharacterized protein N7479_005601 [Penicillium vulpinum]|uniref:SMP-30/Gluconolactonase/LRE-like region domain-containing protein n=1 Tax=Penicillium vulpinum TaxID=29845 RepID=A0A1V6SFC1_9EURO|nr:uncharacterized protein N7479_005601 [Penicillium vulpinum]KAJ5958451.1 hypothetical protein N7479_005601 [Penicillium vulpinum]OQE12449.1 hypothetical protein PENVUL_c001G02494 [Penicillium vulpinum]